MTTPIYDFVKKYADSKTARFHMPGHKGVGPLGLEKYDITEINGADVLYSADGIIDESENNLSSLYGTAHSFYSTEGSTLAIKAMLRLATAESGEERPLVLAARNVHTAFIKAAALLDLDVEFIYPERADHLCRCHITASDVEKMLSPSARKPSAVYVTSPDYLGNMLDISAISAVCDRYSVPLLVDNAHGAYLKFLPVDMHPISLGAAMCADSAHKTLPVLTGGAYLHISKKYPDYVERAREALSLFASTSPSYLTLCSMDMCNARLAWDYTEKISLLGEKALEIKAKIVDMGYEIVYGEPLKIVIKASGRLADHLRECGVEVEFADYDYTVLMLTPENTEGDFENLLSALASYKGEREEGCIISVNRGKRVVSIRKAMLSPSEIISVEDSVGRICASPTVSCPPAVPIVVSGELITENDVPVFRHYGIDKVSVIIE